MDNNSTSNKVIFITHANVSIDPKVPIPEWGLSKIGKERHQQFNTKPIIKNVQSIYSSNEQKAIDGANILAKHLGLTFTKIESLGENDRSSTGYLIEEEFQKTVDAFFSYPEKSIRGWERAIDVQNRIVNTIEDILTTEKTSSSDIAIVAHGGVGALLLCHLLKEKISRKFDQPFNGGGNYFSFNRRTREVIHSWKDISS